MGLANLNFGLVEGAGPCITSPKLGETILATDRTYIARYGSVLWKLLASTDFRLHGYSLNQVNADLSYLLQYESGYALVR